MTKLYKSKFGAELFFFLLLVLGTSSVFMVINKAWPGLIINISVAAFILYLFLATSYTLTNEVLLVKSSFFYTLTIDIFSIQKIRETNNPLSSPAFSLDRLEINYNSTDRVMISPKDKQEFINELKKLNPSVEIEYKAKK